MESSTVGTERNDCFGFATLDLFSLAGGQILDRLLVEGQLGDLDSTLPRFLLTCALLLRCHD